ncbi:MAG: hypothetical protein JO028_11130 [Acidobacteriaceae bacterium]|nr:hypothetical protein [Acidobacteriaceae bacterium]
MDQEARRRFQEHEERMVRVEKNIEEISKQTKLLARAQRRTEATLQQLLDALLTGRGNGHGQTPLRGDQE